MKLSLVPGTIVQSGDDTYEVDEICAVDAVLARSRTTGRPTVLKTSTLVPVLQPLPQQTELSLIDDAAWLEARRRFFVIESLIDVQRTAEMARRRAKETGTSVSSIYRWLAAYEQQGEIGALRPIGNRSRRNKSRLDPRTEAILQDTLDTYYRGSQIHSKLDTCEEVVERCQRAGVPAPSHSTIRHRIDALPEKSVLEGRGQKKKARDTRTLKGGHYDDAQYPLAVIQIDHTKLNVMVVDDVTRKDIGRPWITLAMDVYSRVVTGFYIALNAPDTSSVGVCMANSILPKDQYLARLGLETSWPVFGFPDAIHLDNAREFRGKTLRRACEDYNIHIYFRPVRRPEFGGHIERLLGTLLREMHHLHGYTFANPRERAEYDSGKEAVMTLRQLEKWLTQLISGDYHLRRHSGIGNVAPIERYKKGVLSTDSALGRRPLQLATDERKLRLDFMPLEPRIIQPTGVTIGRICYLHDIFADYLATEPHKKKYIFRRDPRDISEIYFWDEHSSTYVTIPYRNPAMAPMNLWELREIVADLKRRGLRSDEIDEIAIAENRRRLREIEEQAIRETKKQRRSRQQRAELLQKVQLRSVPEPTKRHTEVNDVQPFEEIEA